MLPFWQQSRMLLRHCGWCGQGFSGKSTVIGRVRVSVRLFLLYLLNELTFQLEFCVYLGHGHSSPGI